MKNKYIYPLCFVIVFTVAFFALRNSANKFWSIQKNKVTIKGRVVNVRIFPEGNSYDIEFTYKDSVFKTAFGGVVGNDDFCINDTVLIDLDSTDFRNAILHGLKPELTDNWFK